MNTAQDLFTFFLNIVNNYVVPVVFALAFLMFLVGVYRYFIAGGASEEKVQEGQKFVMWSVIGFVIMFSIWGLVNLFINTLGFNSATRPPLPTFGAPGNTTNTTNTAAQNATQLYNSLPGTSTAVPGGSTINQIGGPSNGSVGQNGSCAGNPEGACSGNLTCDVNHGNVCVPVPGTNTAGSGQSCIGNQSACTGTLICDTDTDTCLQPPGNGTMGLGGSCLGNQNACQNGLTCDNTNTDTCIAETAAPGNGTVGKGGSCLNNNNACTNGLECDNSTDTCQPGSGANINSGSACSGACVDGSTPDPNTCECADGSTPQ